LPATSSPPRRCLIYLYLEDDSIHVAEPKQQNSGIPQVRRSISLVVHFVFVCRRRTSLHATTPSVYHCVLASEHTEGGGCLRC
jgi:hypothetical protein